MTIPRPVDESGPYPTDGSTFTWPFTGFRLDSPDETQVVRVTPDGLEDEQPAGSFDLPLNSRGHNDGGVVTWPVTGPAWPEDGSSVIIRRAPSFTQPTRLANQGPYDARVVETALDRLTKQTISLENGQDRFRQQVLALIAQISGDEGGVQPGDLPFVDGATMGLVFDGRDLGPIIQQTLDSLAGSNGAIVYLNGPPGALIPLKGKLHITGNGVNVICPNPLACYAKGGIAVAGKLSGDPTADQIKLAADTTIGATSFLADTSLHGGVAITTLLAVGDRLTVEGQLDSCGFPIEQQELLVSGLAAATNTVTFATTPLQFAFKAIYPHGDYYAGWGQENTTRIRKQVQGLCASGTSGPEKVFTLATGHGARFSVGAMVIAQDSKLGSDVVGVAHADDVQIHRTPAMVESIAGDVVTLDRYIGNPLETAFGARLTKVDAASGTISGASVIFQEAVDLSDPAPSRWCELRYASNAYVYDAAMLNRGPYGSQREGMRCLLSVDSRFVGGIVEHPKYVGPGQGYGFIADWCADSGVDDASFQGCRHSVAISGGTRSGSRRCTSLACELSDFDFHGGGEVEGYAEDIDVSGGTVTASGSRAAISFGNQTHFGGSHNCVVRGGSVRHYKSATYDTFGVVFDTGADACRVEDVLFDDTHRGIHCMDDQARGASWVVAVNCAVQRCRFNGLDEYPVFVEGNHYAATVPGVGVYVIQGLAVRDCTFNGCTRPIHVHRVDGLLLERLRINGAAVPDAGQPQALELTDCLRVEVLGLVGKGNGRGIRLTNVVGRIIDSDFHDLLDPRVLEDGAGNDVIWSNVRCHGFTSQISFLTSTQSLMLFDPRPPDVINVNDDATYDTVPVSRKGVLELTTLSGEQLCFAYELDVSPAIAYPPKYGTSTAACVDGATGPTAVTDVADGLLYVAPDPTNHVLRIINRRGGNRGITFRHLGEA